MWRAGLKWMYLILGTVIGAGYASGREIWQFFGKESGLAIIIFSILFSISCIVIMEISLKKKTKHYLPVLKHLLGDRLAKAYDVMIIIYLFSITLIMIAGGGVALEVFKIPYWYGILIISILLVVVFIWDIKGMLSLNSFVLPILVGGLVIVLMLFIKSNNHVFEINFAKQGNWPSAFTFTALNILPLVAVLGSIGGEIRNRGEIWIACIGSGVTLGALTYIYNESLIQIADEIVVYEIPLFAILKQNSNFLLMFMSILLWFAIYTTAVSGVFAINSRIKGKKNIPSWLLTLILVIIMIPLTQIGFAKLISILYPLYGLFNLYILVTLMLYPIITRLNTTTR